MNESMSPEQVRDRIVHIAQSDGRFDPAAFFFLNEVVAAAVQWLKSGEMQPRDVAASRGEDGVSFHISGYELLEAMRRLAKERWGCLARQVLESWGVRRTEDVGEIVFLMVNDEQLAWKRRESDTLADFQGGYDFAEAFDSWDG
ncbi:MAG: hypothetical protein LIP77_12275 [Planctomycetes bacterium]|nr:hypothetical protein [Planctomycetota bacterium]